MKKALFLISIAVSIFTFTTAAQNVGIGIANPVSPLQVYSTSGYIAQKPGIRLTVNDGSYTSSWNIYNYQSSLGSFTGGLDFAYEGTEKAYISAYDGSYNTVSDIRLKKDITYYNDPTILDKINKLQPARYLMKDEPETNDYHIGFISQEVEMIFPEVVKDNNGIKMMNYTGLIPIAFEGIKELTVEVVTIKKENSVLEERVKKLEAIVATLRK